MNQRQQEITKDIANENQARAIVYNFLSSLFAKELTKDLVAQLSSEQGQVFLHSLAFEPSLKVCINRINAKLNELNNERALIELAADFCGLFLVDGRTSASPYAGQYLNDEPTNIKSTDKKSKKIHVFGDFHQQIANFLVKSNMQVHRDFPEPSDHIAVILAYTAHLCESTNTQNQLNFINNYLMSWINEFTQQVHLHDQGLFYSAIAELTLKWLEIDVEDLT